LNINILRDKYKMLWAFISSIVPIGVFGAVLACHLFLMWRLRRQH